MPRHHYVPQFLLRCWATEGQLTAYRWIEAATRVVGSRASVVECCQIEDLHAFFGVPRGEREAPERDFFTPRIDTPAAKAHARMLAEGVRGLNEAERTAWARFLVAFGVRTPETLRSLGPEQYRRATAQSLAAPTENREVEVIVASLLDAEIRANERNVPLQIAMEFADDPSKFLIVTRMKWWLRRFDENQVLLGDRPLLSQPPANWPCGIAIDDERCLIALPIAPNVVFFASADQRARAAMRRESPGKLLHRMNAITIERAVEYVFAVDNSVAAFVAGRMRGREGVWPLSSR
jgi:hypothetical protein